MPPSTFDIARLPAPSVEEQAVSNRLGERIRAEIEASGPLPFSRFMELALYAPGLGYYTAGATKFGAEGDFITAPESFPLFGRCLANAVAPILRELRDADILEVGAGSGRLAATLLQELAAHDAVPNKYYILDVSSDLRARQAETIAAQAPRLYEHVCWLDRWPSNYRGVVIANELLDAMPVERFRVERTGPRRLYVDWRADRFVWSDTSANDAIRDRVAALRLEPNYVSEIGFAAEAWIRSLAALLGTGVVFIIDYGFPRAEFYHPDRSSGTLMCHYRHRAHTDPLVLIGLQDITAHVDFTAIARAGIDAGLDLLGYTSQGAFLLANDIGEAVAGSDISNVRAHLALTEQIKKLTLPHEMGELYKVMALGRGIGSAPKGFDLQDRRTRLAREGP